MPTRIMIVHDEAEVRDALSTRFRAAHYKADAVAGLDRFCPEISPDLVVAGTSGVDADPGQVARRIAALLAPDEGEAAVPIILLDRAPDPSRRLAALVGGARDLLAWPLPETLLLAQVRSVLRDSHAMSELARRKKAALSFGFAEGQAGFALRERVLCVTSAPSAPLWTALAEDRGLEVRTLGPDEALAEPESGGDVSAYVIDWSGGAPDRPAPLLAELRARAHSRHAAILVLHGVSQVDLAVEALDSGAVGVACADAMPREIALRLRTILSRKGAEDALRQSTEESYRLAATDPLTGLFNRRYAETYLETMLSASPEDRRRFAVMMIDIDHFKTVNDRHGHAAGDEVLRAVAGRISDNLRAIDLVSRWGGEEFLVVMPNTDHARARLAADRLRRKISRRTIELPGGGEIGVTVSIGVSLGELLSGRAGDPVFGETRSEVFAGLLGKADAALYRAKMSGRNRIEITPSTG